MIRHLTFATALLCGGCASSGQTVSVNTRAFCSGTWAQINVRQADQLTKATAGDIEANNKAREAIGCPYVKPETLKAPAAKIASK